MLWLRMLLQACRHGLSESTGSFMVCHRNSWAGGWFWCEVKNYIFKWLWWKIYIIYYSLPLVSFCSTGYIFLSTKVIYQCRWKLTNSLVDFFCIVNNNLVWLGWCEALLRARESPCIRRTIRMWRTRYITAWRFVFQWGGRVDLQYYANFMGYAIPPLEWNWKSSHEYTYLCSKSPAALIMLSRNTYRCYQLQFDKVLMTHGGVWRKPAG